ncbi:TetR/AcrR family transcriptional regulator [Bacillus sp. 1P06AnD]|uniref:TetR/AcrR family transcriptional regulator n=1 Tax=Bacillus sp. 1P06AnD TaxID=3132208 RepID=UPI0039A14059
MEKKRNAVNMFAKDCIALALFKLMKEKQYEDITITDIAKTAGVSRVTYYRNYNSKEEIITHYVDELGYRFGQETKHLDPTKDMYVCVLAFFRYWIKHREFLLCLHEAKLAYVLLEHANKTISLYTTTAKKKYESRFLLGAMHNIMFEWIKGGATESPEEMAAIVSDLYRLTVPVPIPPA